VELAATFKLADAGNLAGEELVTAIEVVPGTTPCWLLGDSESGFSYAKL
jgi:hypothetical protein